MTGFERYRRKNLITQAELADILKLSPQAVSKWETGKGTPRTPILRQLSALYGVSIEDLLRDDYPDNDIMEEKAKGA